MSSLQHPIAIGFKAKVFDWERGWVLKLFYAGKPREMVEAEAHLAQLAQTSGLPVPKVGEVVEIDGRYGLEYQRVDSISMLQVLMQHPWKLVTFAHQLAELQSQTHKIRLPEMPSLRDRLERKVRHAAMLPENTRKAALNGLEKLPEGDWLCHGDFHPGNILLTARGPVIIDWIDAARGNPSWMWRIPLCFLGVGRYHRGAPGC